VTTVVVVSLDVAEALIDGGGVVNEVTVTVLFPVGHGVVDGLWTGLDGMLRKTVLVDVLVECSVVVVVGSGVVVTAVCVCAFSVCVFSGVTEVGLTVVGSAGLDVVEGTPCS
jgi:hypothetical protein